MGEVYRAEDTKLKRPVALKRVAPSLQTDPGYRKRLLKEAERASKLSYLHIAGIYDVLEERDEIFVVMEYVEGHTLRERMNQPITQKELLEIAIQCSEALAEAHAKGIVHGDIKPENIMVTPTGQVKVLDFGVAKRLLRAEEAGTAETSDSSLRGLSGTPAYMAPELLLEKEADGRADIFSLGIVIYEALTGEHPFRGESFMATCDHILHQEPQPMRQGSLRIPPGLEPIVSRMLAKDPASRYASSADLLAALEALRSGARIAPVPVPAVPRRRAPRRVAVAGLAVVGVVAVLATVPGVRDRVKDALGIPRVPQAKHLAVLPFTAVSGDEKSKAFCDGLVETLTAKLTQLTERGSLQVVPARETHERKVNSVEQARLELGVNLVIVGSFQQAGDKVRISSSLVNAQTQRELRAETIDVPAADPFAIEDRVVSSALNMLELELKPGERQRMTSHGTEVAGAYDFYLQGRGYLQNYDREENLDNAIRVFQRALTLDPNYALAYAGLGDAYWMKYKSSKEIRWVDSSQQACGRAVGLDSKLPAAHVCFGRLYNGTGRYEEAAVEFERAVEAEPTNDDAYRGLAQAYELLGKPGEAEKIYRRAIELRPRYWAGYNWLGAFHFRRGQYQQAAEMFQQVVALAPDNIRGFYNLSAAEVNLGRYTEAIAAVEHSIVLRPTGTAYTNLGNAYFYLRRYEEAVHAYEQAVQLGERDALLWWNLGDGYYWAPGRRAQAAGAYERAIALAEESLRVNPRETFALGVLAICHAMRGEKKAALDSLEKGLRLAPADPEMRFKAALVYNQIGERNQALAWLEKALAAGYPPTIVRDTPNFGHLRASPRFPELLQTK